MKYDILLVRPILSRDNEVLLKMTPISLWRFENSAIEAMCY